MSDPFLGEIKIWSFGWAPRGWMLCNGAQLNINQNAALYSLLGVQFGGDSRTYFNIPDLRGRTPVGVRASVEDPSTFYTQGNQVGSETVALNLAQTPQHVHSVAAYNITGQIVSPQGGNFATAVPSVSTSPIPFEIYLPPSGGTPAYQALSNASVSTIGSGNPHDNMQPFTVINFCICVRGIYPSRP